MKVTIWPTGADGNAYIQYEGVDEAIPFHISGRGPITFERDRRILHYSPDRVTAVLLEPEPVPETL